MAAAGSAHEVTAVDSGAPPVALPQPGGDGVAPGDMPPTRSGRRGVPRWLLIGLSALSVLLLVAVAVLAVQVRSQQQEQSSRDAALDAARRISKISTNVSVANFDQYRQQMLDNITGDFKQQFPATLAAYKKALIDGKVDVTTGVQSAGIVRSDAMTATALVALSGTKKSTQTPPQGAPVFFRMKFDLQNVDGRWLVSNLQFVS